eukprot:gene10031-7921_t
MFPSPSPVRKKNLKRAAPCPVLGSGEPCIGSLTTARIATSIAPPSQNAPPVRKQSELAEREYWKPYMPPCVQVQNQKASHTWLGRMASKFKQASTSTEELVFVYFYLHLSPPSQNAPPVRKQSELAEREYWKPYMPPCVQVPIPPTPDSMAETLAMYLALGQWDATLEFGTTQAVIDSAKKTVTT